ncbi:hypothetical protein [Mesorhizobium sp. M7D.F.Ca.US.005.01.1.1]|uniref:hypothetical protein n=1 Tax=Mesorhizobium sp. M7D.F.Ca.US.005.01.1.1 TaxID=2493678 RepID=UPI0013DFA84D|nr:hypothetical protein [Mesorhizobium sp. M7D.F.Ca.US.005.01.1.1]
MIDKPTYEVSVMEDVGGRLGRHILLKTKDEAEAKALYESLVADEGVKARIETLAPKR